MNHLASFGGSSPIRVPFVCQQIFDGPFSTYLERRGWDNDRLYRGDFAGHSLEEVRSILQEWLYFGLLSHFFDAETSGVQFDAQDFIRRTTDDEGNEVAWITTEKLPDYAKRWYLAQQRHISSGLEAERRRIWSYHLEGLKEAQRFVLRYCTRDGELGRHHPPPTFWPLTPEISLSIIVLGDALTKAAFEATGKELNLNFGNSRLLYDRMLASGWCPQILSTLTTTQQVTLMFSAETLGSPTPRPGELLGHGDCTFVACQQNNVDEAVYITRHVVEGCRCAMTGPSLDEIIEIIRNGDVPLIEFRGGTNDDGFGIRVFPRRVSTEPSQISHREYTAISHIWADGLGNPHDNRLPLCQLRRIQDLVDQLHSIIPGTTQPALWWCDTLCVPVERHYEDDCKRAMGLMKTTYESALQVLVLDSSLQTLSLHTPQREMTALELYLRIKLSHWMRRLWTFQEGILGRRVFFQFQDGSKELAQIDRELFEQEARSGRFIYTRYSHDSMAVLGTFLRQRLPSPHPEDDRQRFQLLSFWKSLEWRSTSKRQDETLCLGTMLDIAPDRLWILMDQDRDDYDGRMIHLLRSLTTIPFALLFQPPPRLSVPGFRWAPTSFLACFRGISTQAYRALTKPTRLGPGETGLLFSSPGLLLRLPDCASPTSFPLVGQDFAFQPRSPSDPDFSSPLLRVGYVRTSNDQISDRLATNVDGTRELRCPALIIGQPLDYPGPVDCILVDMDTTTTTEQQQRSPERTGDRITCSFIAWTGIIRAANATYPAQFDGVVDARVVGAEQEWLVM